jgi:hypothetical protein
METVEEELEPTPFLENLNAYNEMVHTIDAEALIVFRDIDRTLSFRAQLAAQNNGETLRIDFADFIFKKPLLGLIRNEGTVVAVFHLKKEYYRLSYDDLDIEALSGLQIRKEVLISAMMGKVYVDDGGSVSNSVDQSTVVIENGGFRETVTFNSESLPVSVEYVFDSDIFLMLFEEYQPIDGTPFPQKVVIKNNGRTLELRFDEIELNGVLDAVLFQADEYLTEYQEVTL